MRRHEWSAFIQSNYAASGLGVVVPGHGVIDAERGLWLLQRKKPSKSGRDPETPFPHDYSGLCDEERRHR